jgi:ATP-binding cassette subfamily F protein 3
LISVEQLSVEFSGFTLFDDITFLVNPKDKIALVGKNGAGKSTLLKIFAEIQKPSSGNVIIPQDIRIGYLPQHMILNEGLTVIEEAEKAFEELFLLQQQIERLSNEIAERTDYESETYLKLIDDLTHSTEQLKMLGGDDYLADVEKTLMGLGFVRSDFNRQTSEFSFENRMYFCWMSRPITWILSPSNGWKISSQLEQQPLFWYRTTGLLSMP